MEYSNSFFNREICRLRTRCEKWDDNSVCEADMLPFWVADMDFACAQPIQEALACRAAHACYGYTRIENDDMSALCGFWKRRHALDILPAQAIMLPCVVTGLKTCIRKLTQPGDGVIIQTPVYGPFYQAVTDNLRKVCAAPLIRDSMNRYQMDLDLVEEHLRNSAKLMLFCNPHNPVSRLWSMDEIQTLVCLLNRYNALLISDEIHADFVYGDGSFKSVIAVPEAREMAVSLVSASKTFNIAGLQQAHAICGNKNILDLLQTEIHAAGIVSGNLFALEATRAAYELGDEWLDGLLSYLNENRKIVENEVARLLPAAKLTPIDATYLAWLDLSAYVKPAEDLMAKVKAGRVVLSDGTFFGKEEGKGFLRFNFACPQDMLREGLRRLAKALNE
jgi:cysteine-S-conjugate beta-lyase